MIGKVVPADITGWATYWKNLLGQPFSENHVLMFVDCMKLHNMMPQQPVIMPEAVVSKVTHGKTPKPSPATRLTLWSVYVVTIQRSLWLEISNCLLSGFLDALNIGLNHWPKRILTPPIHPRLKAVVPRCLSLRSWEAGRGSHLIGGQEKSY